MNIHYYYRKFTNFILGVMALISSKITFAVINDSEGPNLLIVLVLAICIFGVSYSVYHYKSFQASRSVRLLTAIVIQIVLAIILGICFT
jgi:uncharacterized membrane-anchored protein